MLVYDNSRHRFVIDPHYLTIKPLRKIWDSDKSSGKEIATSLLMWLYHMYNPHSPFRDHRNSTKSMAVVDAVFPKAYVEEKLKYIKERLEAVKDNEVAETAKLSVAYYSPEDEPGMTAAISWYTSHLKQTPLWNAYESYKEAMYNLSKIISDPQATASQIRTASQELDTLPLKMEKMRQQAEKDEAQTLKVSGDRHVKRSERIAQEAKANSRKSQIIE